MCPTCSAAVSSVGAVGQSSLHRAMAAYLRSVGRGDDADSLRGSEVDGLVGWGVLRGLPPNDEPWLPVRVGSG